MTWRGPRTTTDPLLATQAWRTTIRNHWKRLQLPCARCGRAIDYTGPRYYLLPNGKRKLNPRYLVVGHRVSRHHARIMGWTDEQINDINNTQPECLACSNRSGAQLGGKVQRLMRARNTVGMDDSRRW